MTDRLTLYGTLALPLPQLPPMDSTFDVLQEVTPTVPEPVAPPQAPQTMPPVITHDVEQSHINSATASLISMLTASVRPYQAPSAPNIPRHSQQEGAVR